MNRLPRRASRVRSPLRGRSAAVSPLGQTCLSYLPTTRRQGRSTATSSRGRTHSPSGPIVRQRPPVQGPPTQQKPYEDVRHDLPIWQEPRESKQEAVRPILLKLYKLWPTLFEVLDQPWKWLVALVVLVVLLIGIGSLL